MTARDPHAPHGDVLLPEALAGLSAAIQRGAVSATAAETAPAAVDASLASRQAPARRRPSRRLALVGVLGVLVTGTAVAATAPWSPQLGDDHRGHPRSATTPVPAEQRALLQVLRRPQTDADRSAPVRAVLRKLIDRENVGVRTDGVRLLARDRRLTAVLVPVERAGTHDPGYPDATVPDALCVVTMSPDGSGGQTCRSTADVRAGRARTVGYGLVPDGVARIRLTTKTGELIDVPVTNNFYVLPIGSGTLSSRDPNFAVELRRMQSLLGRPIHWLDAAGRRVAKAPG
jgi:hypothetical protein